MSVIWPRDQGELSPVAEETISGQTARLRKLIALSFLAGSFTGCGMELIASQISKTPLTWNGIIGVLFFAFAAHFLNLLSATHNKSVLITCSEIRASSVKQSRALKLFQFTNLLGSIAAICLYCQTRLPIFGVIAAVSFVTSILVEEFSRTRRFKRIRQLMEITDIRIIDRDNLQIVCATCKQEEIWLPYYRDPKQLAKELRSRVREARRLN